MEGGFIELSFTLATKKAREERGPYFLFDNSASMTGGVESRRLKNILSRAAAQPRFGGFMLSWQFLRVV